VGWALGRRTHGLGLEPGLPRSKEYDAKLRGQEATRYRPCELQAGANGGAVLGFIRTTIFFLVGKTRRRSVARARRASTRAETKARPRQLRTPLPTTRCVVGQASQLTMVVLQRPSCSRYPILCSVSRFSEETTGAHQPEEHQPPPLQVAGGQRAGLPHQAASRGARRPGDDADRRLRVHVVPERQGGVAHV
jgi:hypothetical protein